MARQKPFELIYDSDVASHLEMIEVSHHRLIERAIEKQLAFEPGVETRNRKPLVRPSTIGADWELRCGPDNRYRIFYRTDLQAREVRILAIGLKVRDRLFVKGEEFEL